MWQSRQRPKQAKIFSETRRLQLNFFIIHFQFKFQVLFAPQFPLHVLCCRFHSRNENVNSSLSFFSALCVFSALKYYEMRISPPLLSLLKRSMRWDRTGVMNFLTGKGKKFNVYALSPVPRFTVIIIIRVYVYYVSHSSIISALVRTRAKGRFFFVKKKK